MAWGTRVRRTARNVGRAVRCAARQVEQHVDTGLRTTATVARQVKRLQPVCHSVARPQLQAHGVIDRRLSLYNNHNVGWLPNTHDGLRNAMGRQGGKMEIAELPPEEQPEEQSEEPPEEGGRSRRSRSAGAVPGGRTWS